MKRIAVLGSTGSIGKSTLDVVENIDKEYSVVALSANKNYKKLIEQIEKFNPEMVSIGTEKGYKEIKSKFPNLKTLFGEDGLKEIGASENNDILLTAVSGSIGLDATVEAIKKNKRIALANKETMVAGGEFINSLLKKYSAEIIPVDSEHSALFQALHSGESKEIKKLIITASGGSFRNWSYEQIKKADIEQALKHPNWSMGRKITIDSATLVNKGLEVIEAHYLFNIGYNNIEVLIHPESIIHSMIEFVDTTIIAQLGEPDMRVPIQYALTFPNRLDNTRFNSLDFTEIGCLNFSKPRNDIFRGLELAYKAGTIGKTMPAIFNAANEVAVDMFLNRKIDFFSIYTIIEKCMEKIEVIEADSLGKIKYIDKETRKFAYKLEKI